jgi:hypothetical protein
MWKGASALTFVAVWIAACATLLGDDFEITGTTSSAGGAAQGGGGPGGGSMGGSGGGGVVVTWQCDWAPQSIRKVRTLETQPAGSTTWNGHLWAVPANNQVRVFLDRFSSMGGKIVELYSIRSDGDDYQALTADHVLTAHRVGPDHVAAMVVTEPQPLEPTLRLRSVHDDDQPAVDVAIHVLSTQAVATEIIDGDFVGAGNGGSEIGDIIFVQTRSLNGVRGADIGFWQGTAVVPTTFDTDNTGMLGDADYQIRTMLRDGASQNHVLIGDVFEGANETRQFVLPDSPSGQTPPVRAIEELLVGIQPRSGGDYLAGYGVITPQMSFELHLGIIDDAALATHTPAQLTSAGEVGYLTEFGETTWHFTDDSFVLVTNPTATPKELRLIVAHQSGALRADTELPFPNLGIFPPDWAFDRLGAVVLNPLFDRAGGSVFVTWTIEVPSPLYHELYFGEIVCQPQ